MDSVTSWWNEMSVSGRSKMAIMHQKLKKLRGHLKTWNKTIFGDIFKEKFIIQEISDSIQRQAMEHGFTPESKLQEIDLLHQLNKRCGQEAIFWNQKARVKWLKDGECNTSFFHKSTIQHRMRNKIRKIRTDSGDTLEEHQEITNELTWHFSQLLTELNHERQEAIHKVTQCIPSLVNNEHNHSLMKPITMQEVEAIVEQMVDGTSPGPDDFTIDLFHHCWNLLKDEVLELVEESRKKKWILPALNATHLALIPK